MKIASANHTREGLMKEEDSNSQRFEAQLARLEEIVARLENESVGLEEALELFESGIQLARRCRARLEEVEQRVAKLLESDGEGPPETAPLDLESP
jgi:exodeoxyribonuclease VII small subunit